MKRSTSIFGLLAAILSTWATLVFIQPLDFSPAVAGVVQIVSEFSRSLAFCAHGRPSA